MCGLSWSYETTMIYLFLIKSLSYCLVVRWEDDFWCVVLCDFCHTFHRIALRFRKRRRAKEMRTESLANSILCGRLLISCTWPFVLHQSVSECFCVEQQHKVTDLVVCLIQSKNSTFTSLKCTYTRTHLSGRFIFDQESTPP